MADHRLTREAILRYADLSSDHNPLHVDEEAAKASPFKGIVAHGFLLLGGALAALRQQDGYPKRFECRFQAPGRPGDTLSTTIQDAGFFTVTSGGQTLVSGSIDVGSTGDQT